MPCAVNLVQVIQEFAGYSFRKERRVGRQCLLWEKSTEAHCASRVSDLWSVSIFLFAQGTLKISLPYSPTKTLSVKSILRWEAQPGALSRRSSFTLYNTVLRINIVGFLMLLSRGARCDWHQIVQWEPQISYVKVQEVHSLYKNDTVTQWNITLPIRRCQRNCILFKCL